MAKNIFKSHKVQALLLYPVYFVSKILKRDARIWLFGPMNHSFLDNSKYLFLYLNKNHPEITSVFFTEKRELCRKLQKQQLPCVFKWSIKGFYYGLKAQYYFVSAYLHDINFWTSGKAIVFNLWHGIPLKKIEFDITTGPLAKRYQQKKLYFRIFKPWFYRKPDFVLSTSPEVSRIFASAFRVSPNYCPPLGYPRTDIFFWSQNELLQYIKNEEDTMTYELCQSFVRYRYILLYMPTWRDDRSNFLQAALTDIEKLNTILKEQNALLLIKLHPNDSSMKLFRDKSNIKSLKTKMDVYPILPLTNALITDYSSIYFDYMLLKKPMIFYPFDFEKYVKFRSLYFEYEQTVPGPIAKNFDDLLKHLSNLQNMKLSKNFEKLLNRFWQYQDGNSSKRIVKFIKNLERNKEKEKRISSY